MAIKKIAKKIESSKGTGVKVKAEEKQTQQVTSNPRLVSALTNFDEAKAQAKSYLVEVATIVQEEKLTKEEVIVSLMEARGCSRETAGQQFSRIKKLLHDPKTLEELREGVIDLATARAKTTKKQANPSVQKKQQNAEKVIVTSIGRIITAAKEMGTDLASLIQTLKSAAKKAGLK